MAIKTLLPYLKCVTEIIGLDSFQGQTCVVDAYCWMHKALALSYMKMTQGNHLFVISDKTTSFRYLNIVF